MRYASAHSSFARSIWPSIHDASPAVISAPARPTRGRAAGVGVEEGCGVLAGGEVLAADVPVHPQVAAQLQARLAGKRRRRPARRLEERVERGLEVALLGDAAFDGPDLIGSLDAVADLAGELGIPAGVPQRDLARLAGGLEPLAGVLADRLQHPEPVALAVHLHERLVDERLQLVEDGLAGVCADGLDVRERAPAGEDGHAPEQALLRLRRGASGSSRSSRAASAAARACRERRR